MTDDIRIMRERCSSCIMRSQRDGRIPLSAQQLAQIITTADKHNGYPICRTTLHLDEGEQAMCRGYTDAYGLPPAARLAVALGYGHLTEIDEPAQF